ncbi:MAG: M14 family zinc carboxypeptidase [Nanoarchaeota archaeon]|nr:M14 family zinc carboxypeptidase [Nanoarchaeota archaeon]
MKELREIKDYKEFLTVKEINSEIKKIASKDELINLGKSRYGEDIFCVKIGVGKESALIFGFPHPNEPIGSLSSLELIKLIKKSKKLHERFTWYIIPCADPDGAKLNEGWFKGKFTINKYAENYYRSPPHLQTDWGFPWKYKGYNFSNVPKNTLALKKLIDKIKPVIDYPLHNAGFQGAFFLISKPLNQESYKEIISLSQKLKIPLDMGEPEMPFLKEFKKPIYQVPFVEEIYDFMEKNGADAKKETEGGQASIDYSKKVNPKCLGIVGEIPYIYDKKISNRKKLKYSYKEIFFEAYKRQLDTFDFIFGNFEMRGINKKSPFYEMISNIKNWQIGAKAYLENLKKIKLSRKITVAENFSAEINRRFQDSLLLGSFRRLLIESKQNKEIKELIKEVEFKMNLIFDYIRRNSKYKIIPIGNLIKLQIGTLLIAVKSMDNKK